VLILSFDDFHRVLINKLLSYLKTRGRPKKFKLYSTDSLRKISEAYLKYYGKKGCNTVVFYNNRSPIKNEGLSLAELGLNDLDTIVAMENGTPL
jgi:hypothetical protein